MINRFRDDDEPAPTVILNGTVGGNPYEVTILTRDLDQLAELAILRPGRTAQLGPVRVKILSSALAGSRS